MMTSNLAGKSAVVTGAGGGICFAFARLLLEKGVNVLLADLALRPEAEECIKKYQNKPKAIFVRTDVTSWKDLENMFNTAGESFGSVDIVCPGAGIFEPSVSNFWNPPGSAESKDGVHGDHYKTLDVNITHPIRVTQMAISHFMASKPSPGANNTKVVVHTASVASEIGFMTLPMYIASKWALRGFIYSMADLEPELGIRVVGIAPGRVKTPLWLDAKEKYSLFYKDGVMIENWTTPERIAELMLNLTVGEAMTADDGSQIEVKGGLVLEAGMTHVREVPMMMNTGPRVDLPGMTGISPDEMIKETWTKVKTPGWGQF